MDRSAASQLRVGAGRCAAAMLYRRAGRPQRGGKAHHGERGKPPGGWEPPSTDCGCHLRVSAQGAPSSALVRLGKHAHRPALCGLSRGVDEGAEDEQGTDAATSERIYFGSTLISRELTS